MDNTAISLANALSSTVATISCRPGGPTILSNGFALDEALEIRLMAPVRRPNLFRALETARLHQTMDKHRSVPVIRKEFAAIGNNKPRSFSFSYFLLRVTFYCLKQFMYCN